MPKRAAAHAVAAARAYGIGRAYGPDMTSHSHVAILMATFNGSPFLSAQLHSFLAQSHQNWSLWVSDDGSSDETRAIIADFQAAHPDRRIILRDGPGSGSTLNFMTLLCDPTIPADYVALSDQDDIWLPDHLSRALGRIDEFKGTAVLYGARTIIAGPDMDRLGMSPLFRKPPGFRNALVQSIAGGNTMLLNAKARSIVVRAGLPKNAVCHDWWLYQILSGAGAEIIYDPEPTVLYRQHGANQIGSNFSAAARLARIAGLLGGRYRDWNNRNITALEEVSEILTPRNRALLSGFSDLRRQRGPSAIATLRRLGLFRQTSLGSISLAAAAFLGLL